MKLPIINNTLELLENITAKDLFTQLSLQIQKDFNLISLDFNLDEFTNPTELFNYLKEIVSHLIHQKTDSFFNLLYRIDVQETQILAIINSESFNIEEQISFIILKREWQKVWFKTSYKY